MKRHMKRISAPKNWLLDKKAAKYVTRPLPRSRFNLGMPLNLAIKMLGYATTGKEVKKIVNNQEVLVDKKRVKNPRMLIGLMDVLELPAIKAQFRVLLNHNRKVCLIETDKPDLKPCKITGKKMTKGKIQLSLHDSRTILTDNKDYKTGDTVVLKLPKNEIVEHLKFEKGSLAYLFGGKRIGETAKIESITDGKIILKNNSESFETRKECMFIIGKDKPVVKIK